jgi:hypothetical protein
MSEKITNGRDTLLPNPVVLSPEQVQQVAGGTAAVLSSAASGGGTTTGYRPPPDSPSRQV